MLNPILFIFCLTFAFGIWFALFVVRRLDLGANFFRMNGAISAVLMAGGYYFSKPFLGPKTQMGLLILAGVGVFYAATVLWMPVLLERALILLLMGGLSMGLWKAIHLVAPAPVSSVSSLLTLVLGGAVIGTTLVAMNVGHSYLSMTQLTIRPLKSTVLAIAALVGLRLAWLVILVPILAGTNPEAAVQLSRFTRVEELTLVTAGLVRVLFGIIGALILVYLTWKTVQLQSTQSATGILYGLLVLALMGEICALFITLTTGLPV